MQRSGSKLTDAQISLLDLLRSAVNLSDGNKISYHREWLGYLPFGVYHWVEVNGTDISAQIKTMDSVRADLEQLVAFEWLIEVRRNVESYPKTPDDDVYLEFALKPPR